MLIMSCGQGNSGDFEGMLQKFDTLVDTPSNTPQTSKTTGKEKVFQKYNVYFISLYNVMSNMFRSPRHVTRRVRASPSEASAIKALSSRI
jgi:hypothetical protein